MEDIIISYEKDDNIGVLEKVDKTDSSIWQRLVSSSLNFSSNSNPLPFKIKLPWYQVLSILREYSPLQRQFNFKFITDPTSKEIVQRFISELKAAASARNRSITSLPEEQIVATLQEKGFTKRDLRSFQIRDISRLISIPNGANFSVPGAGKTTVTFAAHLLTADENDKMFVICPKSAFSAWNEIIEECINFSDGWSFPSRSFINLSQFDDRQILELYGNNENRFFYTNYENFVARKEVFSYLVSTFPTHLVLDESHRMKAGQLSQRGAALLSIANLPKRKDILSGTPMPQNAFDLQAQFDFLWSGSSLGQRIQRGENPANVITGLFTRTTKEELGLPPVNRRFIKVPMSKPQAALYGVVKNDMLRQMSSFRDGRGMDIIKARKSVMRLLQLGSNPILAVRGISEDIFYRIMHL